MNTNVVLVDTNDKPIGSMPKQDVHKMSILHRAFSIFIFNCRGELMMQHRALDKHHFGGLWTNTCSGHPVASEPIEVTASKRLIEEMGISCDLIPVSKLIHKTELGKGLIEHEYDHIFIGYSDDEPFINQREVSAWKWMDIEALNKDLTLNPVQYTDWLKPTLDSLINYLMVD